MDPRNPVACLAEGGIMEVGGVDGVGQRDR